VGRVVDALKPIFRNVGVQLGRAEAGVSQKFLNDSQIRSAIKKIRGKGVAESMRVCRARRTGVDDATNISSAEAMATEIKQQRRRRGTFGHHRLTRASEISLDPQCTNLVDRNASFFRSFPENGDCPFDEVDIIEIKSTQFGNAKAGGVQQFDHNLVTYRSGVIEFDRCVEKRC
jgi:hypothetical protein